MCKHQIKPYVKKQLQKSLTISITFSSFVGVFVALIPMDEKWWIKIIVILSVFLASFVIVFVYLLSRKKRIVAEWNNVKINAMYGDLLNLHIDKEAGKPVVVIPVNSSYDCDVEDDLNVKDPIVSSKTLHGKWIRKIAGDKADALSQLKNDIEQGIKTGGLRIVESLPNKRGNKDRYKLGSTIFVERDDYTYLLFALTDFDEQNHVIERTIKDYTRLINDLVIATNQCQGRDVYIPLMGTQMSLFGLDCARAYEIMKAAFINQKSSLKSSITFVIYNGDKDKVSIYD